MGKKLKTLKEILEGNGVDFDDGDSTQSGDTLIDLRQEAIKWIKDIREKHDLPNFSSLSLLPTSYQEGTYWYDYDERLNWIKHFFNIEECDLE